MAVMVGPTPQDGIEPLYQPAGSRTTGARMTARACRTTECILALDGLISNLSRSLRRLYPRKSNPCSMCMTASYQGTASPRSPRNCSTRGRTCFFQYLARGTGDNEVVSVFDQIHLLACADSEVLLQQCLQPVQGEVGQRRRDDAALRRTVCRRVLSSFVHKPGLQPLPKNESIA